MFKSKKIKRLEQRVADLEKKQSKNQEFFIEIDGKQVGKSVVEYMEKNKQCERRFQ